MDAGEFPLKDQTEQIIKIGIKVHRTLGCGFLEIIYKDALELEFRKAGLHYEREKEYVMGYEGLILRHCFYADFVVFDNVILEIKAKEGIAETDIILTINYLKCSGCKIGLLLNFGLIKLQIKRVIF